jgi:hypothetical protein
VKLLRQERMVKVAAHERQHSLDGFKLQAYLCYIACEGGRQQHGKKIKYRSHEAEMEPASGAVAFLSTYSRRHHEDGSKQTFFRPTADAAR